MAKNAKKKQNVAGLIFIWVLILIFAVGIFGVIRSYKLENSTIIANNQLAEIVAAAFETKPGKLTEDDLATIEGLSFADNGNHAEIMLFLPGYNEAYKAYTAEGVTEEQKKEIDPSKFIFYTYMSDTNIYDDIHMFKGITSFNFTNNNKAPIDKDVLTIVAETAPDLTELGLSSYEVKDFSKVSMLPKLEALTINSSNLSDISAISSLENLTYLDLSDTGLTDISALKSLDNEKIEIVYLAGNNITDWSPLDHIDADKVIKEEITEDSTETESDTETESEKTSETENLEVEE